ncbi:MAG: hypothetical protein ACYTGQ_05930 [Planctomycetota bacterium]
MFTRLARVTCLTLAGALIHCGLTYGQPGTPNPGFGPTFSVDFQGPTAGGVPGPFSGVPDFFGFSPIDEGSILTPGLPGPPGPNPPLPGPLLPAPGIMIGSTTGAPGSIPGGLGLLPGAAAPLPVEVDALSYGHDYLPFNFVDPLPNGIENGAPNLDLPPQLYFSVDEFAFGLPGSPAPPNVFTENTGGGVAPPSEAAADVFAYLGVVAPTAPGGPVIGNTDVMDGDGVPRRAARSGRQPRRRRHGHQPRRRPRPCLLLARLPIPRPPRRLTR